MAKSNYQSAHHTAGPARMDTSSWINQQEKMYLYMQNQKRELEDRKAENKEKAYQASLQRLKESRFGERPDFKNTGIEALDYNYRLIGAKLQEENFKLDQEILEKERQGILDPIESSLLSYKKSRIMAVPEKMANAELAFRQTVEKFNQRLSEGKILPTPENIENLRRIHDGDYSIEYDPNTFELMVVFQSDDENEEGKVITYEELLSEHGLGKIIEAYNIRDVAKSLGDTIGSSTDKTYDGLYQITTEGIKFDDEELRAFVNLEANNNPNIMDSFAFQKYGKYSVDELSEEERDSIIDEFIVYLKAGINKKYEEDFDAGLGGYNVAKQKLAETRKQNKIENERKDRELKIKEEKHKKEYGDSEIFQDYTVEDDKKIPTYGLGGYEINIGGEHFPEKIKATAIKAYPDPDSKGNIIIKASDGINEYNLNQADLAELKRLGITRERIESDFRELNKETTEETIKASNTTINYFKD